MNKNLVSYYSKIASSYVLLNIIQLLLMFRDLKKTWNHTDSDFLYCVTQHTAVLCFFGSEKFIYMEWSRKYFTKYPL